MDITATFGGDSIRFTSGGAECVLYSAICRIFAFFLPGNPLMQIQTLAMPCLLVAALCIVGTGYSDISRPQFVGNGAIWIVRL